MPFTSFAAPERGHVMTWSTPRGRGASQGWSRCQMGDLTVGGSRLHGLARNFWHRWRELLLATDSAPSDSAPDKPYSDAAILRNMWGYARFCSA
eukprot:8023686-Pyramimonas_sp.AAC.1